MATYLVTRAMIREGTTRRFGRCYSTYCQGLTTPSFICNGSDIELVSLGNELKTFARKTVEHQCRKSAQNCAGKFEADDHDVTISIDVGFPMKSIL